MYAFTTLVALLFCSTVKGSFFSLYIYKTFVGLQDILITSIRYVLKTPSTRFWHNNFSSSRRLEDTSQDVLKTSWKTKNCYAEDILETNKIFTGDICIKSKSVPNKSISHKSISNDKSKLNPTCINENTIISKFVLFCNSSSISILRIKTSDNCLVL